MGGAGRGAVSRAGGSPGSAQHGHVLPPKPGIRAEVLGGFLKRTKVQLPALLTAHMPMSWWVSDVP